jgi:uncharacterized protein (DUF608 family)
VQACKAGPQGAGNGKGSPELEGDSLQGHESWHIRAGSASSSSLQAAAQPAASQELFIARSEAERLQLELQGVEGRFEEQLRSLREQVRHNMVFRCSFSLSFPLAHCSF